MGLAAEMSNNRVNLWPKMVFEEITLRKCFFMFQMSFLSLRTWPMGLALMLVRIVSGAGLNSLVPWYRWCTAQWCRTEFPCTLIQMMYSCFSACWQGLSGHCCDLTCIHKNRLLSLSTGHTGKYWHGHTLCPMSWMNYVALNEASDSFAILCSCKIGQKEWQS